MAEGTNPSEDDITPEAAEKAKNRSRLNALILAGVFLLGIALPKEYKAFAPFLFLIPFIIGVVNKIRQAGEKPGDSPRGPTYSPPAPAPNPVPSIQPYSYRPKDPKDPRKYKPIG